jgi:hypothetical protein
LGRFTRTNKSIGYWQANYSIDYTNDITRKDCGGNYEKHQHSSFGDQVCNQFGTILEDYARHQKIHFQIG